MPRIFDISVLLRPDMPTYPDEPGPRIDPLKEIVRGEPANVSIVSFGTHTGTHVDPPFHFFPGGSTVEKLPLEAMVGPALVVDLNRKDPIDSRHLEEATIPLGVERLILKTPNSELWARPGLQTDFTGLTPDAARWLVDRCVRLVGIDYLSIEPYSGDGDTHRILLGSGIVVLEGLDLRGVRPGGYTLVCLPLRLEGADGCPARAILVE